MVYYGLEQVMSFLHKISLNFFIKYVQPSSINSGRAQQEYFAFEE